MSRATVFCASLAWALLLAPTDTTAEEWTKGRMSLFVFAATVAPSTASEQTDKELKAALDAAEKELKSVEQDLKKRHGGKREKWPDEASAALELATAARRQALYRWLDTGRTQKALDAWTKDLTNLLFNKRVEHMARASSPEDADLTVEVIRAPSGAHNALYLRIAPGGRLDPSRLTGQPFDLKTTNVTEVHSFSASEPHWEIEAMGNASGGLFAAHGYAHSGLGVFIRRHFDVLAAARVQP